MITRYSKPDSRLYSAVHPDRAGWTRPALLLGQAVDTLNWLAWAKTKDGRKNRNRPASVLPPDVKTGKGTRRPGSAPPPQPLSKIKAAIPGPVIPQREREHRLARLFGR